MGKREARNRIQPIDFDELKKGTYTKQSKIDKLAKEVGVNKYELRGFLRKKLKPGLKIAGRRFFSNIDEIAGFLTEKYKENLLRIQKSKALGPRSKIIPFAEDPHGPRPNTPISPLPRLKYLAKQHEIPWKVLQDALNAGKSKGWNEKDTIKSLLKTLDNEDIPSDKLRKFIEDQTKKITDPRGLRIDRLKDYVKNNTDIRWRTIQNALDMGKSPKDLLDDLKGKTGKVGLHKNRLTGEVEFRGHDEYAERLQKDYKKWNANRRALKSTGNKIVEFKDFDKIAKDLYQSQKKIGAKHGLIPQDIIKRLLQKGRSVESLTGLFETRNIKDLDWVKATDKRIQVDLGLLDDNWKSKSANKISPGPHAKWKNMRSLHDLSKEAFHTGKPTTKLTGDNLKLWNAYAKHRNEEDIKWKRRTRQTNRARLERIEVGRAKQLKIKNLVKGLKGSVGQLGAGIVLNYLAEKYVKPHTDAFGTYLGTELRKKVDQWESKNQ